MKISASLVALMLLSGVLAYGWAGEHAATEPQRGTVTLQLDVDVDGYPHNIVVISGVSKRADKEVVEKVKRWHFDPAVKDGAPVAVKIRLQVNVDCSNPNAPCKLERTPPSRQPRSGEKPRSR